MNRSSSVSNAAATGLALILFIAVFGGGMSSLYLSHLLIGGAA